MPNATFQRRIDDWVEIHELPGSWPSRGLREVLRLAEFDDAVTDDEVPDMAVMALQDLDEREACDVVLKVVFGDAMTPGVRQNVTDDLFEDRPWEHFADVGKQAGLFDAVVLLQRAFPTHFGIPDAVRLRLNVRATNEETRSWLLRDPSPSLILRLLASGMEYGAVLKRLYEKELASDVLSSADAILWRIHEVSGPGGSQPTEHRYDICSSYQWLGPLEDREPWEGIGWPDAAR